MNRILLFLFCICVIVLDVYSQVFRNLSVKDGLSDLIVNSIYKDSVGYVWFGTSSSVERFDGVSFKHFPIYGANEKEKEVNVIIGMPHNEVWFGNNVGLWRINGADKMERVAGNRIASKVFSLLHDRIGKLYIGSENGLFIYEESELTHGTPTSVFLNCDPKKETDGTLWFGSSQGLLYTNTEKINQSKKELHPLQITDVSVDGIHYIIKSGEENQLPIGTVKEKLTIHFSGFTYTDPHYMKGKDDRWKILSGVSEVSYYGLSADDYIFRLRHFKELLDL